MRSDVARIARGIVHPDDFARRSGRAGDAFAQRNVIDIHALVIAHAEAVTQHLLLRVYQQDAEGIVVDEPPHAGRNFREQLVDIENG